MDDESALQLILNGTLSSSFNEFRYFRLFSLKLEFCFNIRFNVYFLFAKNRIYKGRKKEMRWKIEKIYIFSHLNRIHLKFISINKMKSKKKAFAIHPRRLIIHHQEVIAQKSQIISQVCIENERKNRKWIWKFMWKWISMKRFGSIVLIKWELIEVWNQATMKISDENKIQFYSLQIF